MNTLRRVESIIAESSYKLRITWRDRQVDVVDMKGVISAFEPFSSLKNKDVFASVRVADWGSGIEWNNGLDYSSDSLDHLAAEQRGMTGAEFKVWLDSMGLSIQETADLFGVATSTIKEYRKTDRTLPVVWQIACLAMKRDPETFFAHYRPRLTGRPKKAETVQSETT